jgi:hypothetical protein
MQTIRIGCYIENKQISTGTLGLQYKEGAKWFGLACAHIFGKDESCKGKICYWIPESGIIEEKNAIGKIIFVDLEKDLCSIELNDFYEKNFWK